MGSVFSPYYAWSGRSRPDNHVAINVALYGPNGRWAMTERGVNALSRGPDHFAVGASRLEWDGQRLAITIKELAAPIPFPVRGRIIVTAPELRRDRFVLDDGERHVWRPLAPRAHAALDFTAPRLSWRGDAYLDTNWGAEPLEAGFVRWDWQRAHSGEDAVVIYAAEPRQGKPRAFGLRFTPAGDIEALPIPPPAPLGGTIWRVARTARAEHARLVRTWEDTPFYNRSEVLLTLMGLEMKGVHESLDCNRLRQPWVRLLLPFRMPRWTA